MKHVREVKAASVILVALALLTALNAPALARKKSSVGGICAGLRGAACKSGLVCEFTPAAQCGAADQPGTCVRRPQVCTKIYKPVCGCDDQTYGNDCTRLAAGVGKLKDGPCTAN